MLDLKDYEEEFEAACQESLARDTDQTRSARPWPLLRVSVHLTPWGPQVHRFGIQTHRP